MTAADYLAGLPFDADRFQIAAAAAIDRGETVIVTAPTGSGKTVVAEAAVHRAFEQGTRALYTTPIKALSNQKFKELQGRYGEAGVGLLTGDNSIRGTAPVVVMTTEVLRNMMYAGSPDLANVGTVILDEVHYLQDRERGAVWEEIIIHLDPSIPLVCLSATVANAEDFASWIEERRGPTTLVVETERPVPLEPFYLVRDRFSGHELRMFPLMSGDRPNDRLASMLRRDRNRRRRYAPPRRFETADDLQRRGLLPAIYFIFSRKGCEAAARTVVDRGLRLASPAEADEIERLAGQSTAGLSAGDRAVLGHDTWLRLLRRGVAAHHAGMVPAMKEAVEQLFAAGLVKLVFATETLALGINMPARTVVLESLTKFTGEAHETLQPGDFTQLTGRAGRRGIDTDGAAVVLHSEYLEFERVVGIAARGAHPLRSSFRPTYNMAVNLIARYREPEAERLLRASFAEFAGARRRAQLETEIAAERARFEELRGEAEDGDGDIWSRLDGEAGSHADVMARFAACLTPGSVLEWEEGGGIRRVIVLAVGRGKSPRILAATGKGRSHRFASGRLPATLRRVGAVALPKPFRPRDAAYLSSVGELLDGFEPSGEIATAYEFDEDDPPDLAARLDAARQARRVETRLERLLRRADTGDPGVTRSFRSIRNVLERLGYADGWSLSAKGGHLRRIYSALDLVLAEVLSEGLLDDLDVSALAGVASAFTYEPRHGDGPTAWPAEFAEIGEQVDGIWSRIHDLERQQDLDPTRQPDPGFALTAAAWASGASLTELFDDEDQTIGDFVRNCRQLIDLLRQIGEAGSVSNIREALAAVDRGVVTAAGAV